MLVTLTVGGNDLLSAYGSRARRSLLDKIENDIADAYDFLARHASRETARRDVRHRDRLRPVRSAAAVIPGVYDAAGPLPLDILDRFNAHVRALGTWNAAQSSRRRARPLPGPRRERGRMDQWYWRRSLIEPNARGGTRSELWLDVLGGGRDRVTPAFPPKQFRFRPLDPFVSVSQLLWPEPALGTRAPRGASTIGTRKQAEQTKTNENKRRNRLWVLRVRGYCARPT